MNDSELYRKRLIFSLKFQMVQPKWICISIYLFTVSFICKNTRDTYPHKHEKMTMNSNLASSGLNTISFLTIRMFRKYVIWKVIC